MITLATTVIIITTLSHAGVTGRHIDESNKGDKPLYNKGMFQGDIAGISSRSDRNAIVDMTKLWPSATVPYLIGETAVDITNEIMEGMKEYHEKTCIKFVPWEPGMQDYVRIERYDGCWSRMGREGGEQYLSLGSGCFWKGLILHELGHAIGLLHEQSRSDRDNFIEIQWENVKDDNIEWFDKVKPWENFLLDEPFDYQSIMLYEEGAFSKNGNDTVRVKQPNTVIGPVWKKLNLSESDVRRVNRLYECFGEKRPQVPQVPDLKCDFEVDDCDIKNQEDMGTYFERVTNTVGGRYGSFLEILKGPKSVGARLITPYWQSYGRPKTCLSFEYYSDGKSIHEINVAQQGSDTIIVARLDTDTKDEWIKKRIDLTMPGSTRFFIEVIFDSRLPHGRVALDNLVYSVDNCK